jgi:hypothetical protein
MLHLEISLWQSHMVSSVGSSTLRLFLPMIRLYVPHKAHGKPSTFRRTAANEFPDAPTRRVLPGQLAVSSVA